MPLTRGKYSATNPSFKLYGLTNATQASNPARTNADWFGLSGISDGAMAGTGVCVAVPIPVEIGDIFTTVRIAIGATAESGGSHAFAALYSGIATPALLAQSTDATGATAVGPVSAVFTFTLASAVAVTPTNAPNGFIYASISMTGTPATCMSVATPTAVGYQLFTTGPLFFSMTHGSAVAGTAPATIASPAAKAVAPIVWLA